MPFALANSDVDPNIAKEFKENQDENLDEEEEDFDDVVVRSKKNFLYLICFKISNHSAFSVMITLFILINTFILALDRYPID